MSEPRQSDLALEELRRAVERDSAAEVRQLLRSHPQLRGRIHDPLWAFESPAVAVARSREMLDALLEAGADINKKSEWWAGGFGLLHGAAPELAAYAIERGAVVDVHAAARLGMIERLRELISADPAQVNARGGDGQTPLHFATTLEVAAFLLEQGADVDRRDVDHESTPAQYMIRDRQEIARYLVERGCATDILMVAALGHVDRIRRHLDDDPDCIRLRVSEESFPMIQARSGGTIYQWTLGWYVGPHEVALNFGHEDAYQLLMERSPADVKLLVTCWSGRDEDRLQSILRDSPDLVASMAPASRRQLAHAARNNDAPAVQRMLTAGLPVDVRSQHGGTPLHWAAWHGNLKMVGEILRRTPPLEAVNNDYRATPLQWALHGSENGWGRCAGDYPATVDALITAGARLPEKLGGTGPVKEVLRRHGVRE